MNNVCSKPIGFAEFATPKNSPFRELDAQIELGLAAGLSFDGVQDDGQGEHSAKHNQL